MPTKKKYPSMKEKIAKAKKQKAPLGRKIDKSKRKKK